MSTYLRVEAVNLFHLIEDTEDLSTIRGSSLMILDLYDTIEQILKELGVPAAKITSGASQTVVRVSLPADKTLDKVVQHVDQRLRTDSRLQYATLVVDAYEGEYDQAREALLAKNRFRQMRQARLSIAGAMPDSRSGDPPGDRRAPWCFVDHVRPAARLVDNVRNDEKKFVSLSVAARRDHGFQEKQAFYQRVAGWKPQADTLKGLEAAWHFHQIATKDERDDDTVAPQILDGKLALLYVDGNRFGFKQAQLCRDEASQHQWDDLVQGPKIKALQAVLQAAWDAKHADQLGPGWWNRTGKQVARLRLETLLWGGDELLWVVPAWQGWQVAGMFYDVVRSSAPPPVEPARTSPSLGPTHRQIRNLDAKLSKKQREEQERERQKAKEQAQKEQEERKRQELQKLSYAAGLVFCHAEAPIHRVWHLAKELAELAKEAGQDRSTEEEKSLLAYAVLESFDQLGQDVQAARRRHLPFPPADDAKVNHRRMQFMVLHADDLSDEQLLGHIRWMKTHFPRGAVYKLLRILRSEAEAGREGSEFYRWFNRAIAEIPDGEIKRSPNSLSAFGDLQGQQELSEQQRIRWLHLAELWDYVV